jgi:hypothetical protein
VGLPWASHTTSARKLRGLFCGVNMAGLFVSPFTPALALNGIIAPAATLTFYATGTSTPANVYADAGLVTSLGSVVTANAQGQFVAIYLSPTQVYRAVLKTSAGVVLGDIDPVTESTLTQLSLSSGTSLVGFLQTGAGAIAGTAQAKLREVVSVKDFGALSDGSISGATVTGTDNTAAFLAAVASVANYGTVFVPAGQYRIIGPIAVGTKTVLIRGSGVGTQILFGPAVDGPCFEFGTSANQISYFQGLRDLVITSPDTTYSKIGVHLQDCSGFTMRDVHVTGSVSNGLANYMFGGAAGSIGLQTNGRDTSEFTNLLIAAQRPIVIGPNRNSTIAADHYHFENLYLLGSLGTGIYATAFPLVEVLDSPMGGGFPYWTALSNISFAGFQAWVGGTGLRWSDTTSTGISNNVLFENVRHEQSHDTTKYSFYINRTNAALRALIFRNIYCGQVNAVSVPGIFARRITATLRLDGFQYVGSDVTKSALDIDGTVDSTVGTSCRIEQGAAVSLVNQRRVVWGPSYPASALPQSFEMATTTSGSTLTRSDMWQGGAIISLADSASQVLSANTETGAIVITSDTQVSAMISLLGANNLVQKFADPAGIITLISGTAGYTNIYYSAGNYMIENKTGAARKYRVYKIGNGNASFTD